MSEPKYGDVYYRETVNGLQEITVIEVDGQYVWYLPGKIWLYRIRKDSLFTETGEQLFAYPHRGKGETE